jgi:hypothetical protein
VQRIYKLKTHLEDYESTAEAWLSDYEDDEFEQQILDILEQLEPFYRELHG